MEHVPEDESVGSGNASNRSDDSRSGLIVTDPPLDNHNDDNENSDDLTRRPVVEPDELPEQAPAHVKPIEKSDDEEEGFINRSKAQVESNEREVYKQEHALSFDRYASGQKRRAKPFWAELSDEKKVIGVISLVIVTGVLVIIGAVLGFVVFKSNDGESRPSAAVQPSATSAPPTFAAVDTAATTTTTLATQSITSTLATTPTPESIPQDPPCSCASCTLDVLSRWSGDRPEEFKCGDRMSYLINELGRSDVDACRLVAGVEFPSICGPECNPDLCHTADSPNPTFAEAWTPPQFTAEPHSAPNPPFTDDDDIYCFPNIATRQRHIGLWPTSDYPQGLILDVKESGSASGTNRCGPGDNTFSGDRVTVETNVVDRSQDTLTLEFGHNAKTNQWESSEVRLLLPGQDLGQSSFGYGTFEFSIQSTSVVDTITDSVVDTKLPPAIILGLFSWDPTDDFQTHENWNHEVDVEISRWDNADFRDAQFLVQPWETSHSRHRFYTGNATERSYNQETPRSYKIKWEPARIHWIMEEDTIQKHSHYISAEHYLFYAAKGFYGGIVPDFIQCLPANVEIRINLWSLNGADAGENMLDLAQNEKVRVVIDKFAFHPSSEPNHVADGGFCTKHCHCNYPNSICQNGVCTLTS